MGALYLGANLFLPQTQYRRLKAIVQAYRANFVANPPDFFKGGVQLLASSNPWRIFIEIEVVVDRLEEMRHDLHRHGIRTREVPESPDCPVWQEMDCISSAR